MDQNSPEDIFTLGEYLGRAQYGTRPLFYGQTYASKPALKEVEDVYKRQELPMLRAIASIHFILPASPNVLKNSVKSSALLHPYHLV